MHFFERHFPLGCDDTSLVATYGLRKNVSCIVLYDCLLLIFFEFHEARIALLVQGCYFNEVPCLTMDEIGSIECRIINTRSTRTSATVG